MPQLDFANPLMTSTLVWLFIIFGVLYFLLKTYALPRVESVLEQRAARIRADLDAAREAQVAGEAALAEVRAATAQARAEAQAAVTAALAEAQAQASAQAEAINARLAAQVQAAEASVAAARDAAMGALREVAGDTAKAMLDRLGVKAPANDVQALVERVAAEGGR